MGVITVVSFSGSDGAPVERCEPSWHTLGEACCCCLGKSICRSLGMKQETGNYNLVKSYRAGLPRVCP